MYRGTFIGVFFIVLFGMRFLIEFYGDYQAGAEVGSRAPLVNYTTDDLEPCDVFDRRDTDA